jgi:hypothetical protein
MSRQLGFLNFDTSLFSQMPMPMPMLSANRWALVRSGRTDSEAK